MRISPEFCFGRIEGIEEARLQRLVYAGQVDQIIEALKVKTIN